MSNTDDPFSRAGFTSIDFLRLGLAAATKLCHEAARKAGWWSDSLGQPIERNKGELIALMHSELSEMLEGERKGLMDTHLPNRRAAEVELADLLIRAFDYAGKYGYDLSGAVAEKLAYNLKRLDHKMENRMKDGGKKF